MKTIGTLFFLCWVTTSTAQVALITKEIIDDPNNWISNLSEVLPIIPDEVQDGISKIEEEHFLLPGTEEEEKTLMARVVETFDEKGRLISRTEQQITKGMVYCQLEYRLQYRSETIRQTIQLRRYGKGIYNYGSFEIRKKELPGIGTAFEIYESTADRAAKPGPYEQQIVSGQIATRALLFHDIDTNVLIVPQLYDFHPGLEAAILRLDFGGIADITKGEFVYSPVPEKDHSKLEYCRIYSKPAWDDKLEIKEYRYWSNRLGTGRPLFALVYDTERAVITESKTYLGGVDLEYKDYQHDERGTWISRSTYHQDGLFQARHGIQVERKISYR